jgi:hypothetical protein
MAPITRSIAAGAALTLALAASPTVAGAVAKTRTLRVFDHPVHVTLTSADGTVSEHPAGPPQAGDVLEVDSRIFKGTHKRHEKRPSMSGYLRCEFTGAPAPDCFSYIAHRGSLLRFHMDDVLGGTGRYEGASGRVVSSKETASGSDIVARVRTP